MQIVARKNSRKIAYNEMVLWNNIWSDQLLQIDYFLSKALFSAILINAHPIQTNLENYKRTRKKNNHKDNQKVGT